MSVPCGFAQKGGVPIALQIAGKPLSERTLFQIGHAYQQATQWHETHPDLEHLAATGTV
jgi:aspartyl-tRNA(Asn)/glutamyl-tRNA(Gln) amidotransferase subunit A